jgi:putative DNA primase/helicase
MTEDGMVRLTVKDETVERHRFTGPFQVIGEGRDRVGAGRGLWLAWQDRDGRDQRGFVRHADLVGSGVDWLKELTDRGFPGPIEHGRITWLRQALHGCRPAGRITMIRRTGWVGSAFVLPHKTIGETENETIMFDGRADIARYGERGTLDDWCKSVAAPAADNTRLIFALSAGFAGPIADLLEEESFGFNLTGPSSVGKSTALIAAGSIWGGGGPLGFAYSWRLTDNGAEGVACAHSGTFLALDELGQLNAEVATALTYMLGNGLGKSRAGRGGEARRTAEWRIVLLSTGEVGIATKIEEAGRGRKAKAGSLVRLIDIPADPGKGRGLFDDCHGKPPAELAQHLKAAALSHYGLAGPAFVSHLAHSFALNPQFKATLRERIDLAQKDLLEGIDTVDGQVMRVARHFAVVAIAGDSARATLNLPWEDGEPISAARTCLKAWMSQRGGSGPQEILTAVTALRDAIETHGQARFQHLKGLENSDRLPIRDLLGFHFDLEDEAVWGFTPAGLKEVLRGVGDFQTLLGGLVERGIIRKGPDRLQTGKKIGGKKWWLYAVVDSSLFKDEQQ